MVKVNRLEIRGIAGLNNLDLKFGPGLNLLCGPNGVGKTTILECIGHSFSLPNTFLRKNVSLNKGSWTIYTNIDNNVSAESFSRDAFKPHEASEPDSHVFRNYSKEVIAFKNHRGFQHITSSAHVFNLTDNQQYNLNKAKECLGMLDNKALFSHVAARTQNIFADTEGKTYFENLSSGHKSCLAVILGLIKEIEYRIKPAIKIDEFEGLVVIDEVDLHLHPQWQSSFIRSLKRLIPKAQIIATTHSPHIVQILEPNELISLGFDKDNKVYVREIARSKYGFQGWTVEEILEDVMGLAKTRSEKYLNLVSAFAESLDQENIAGAREIIDELELMLHPNNSLRKLFKIQLASLGGDEI